MRHPSSGLPGSGEEIQITLDGITVEAPSQGHSLNAIRHHLEAIALEQQRVLCALNIDGRAANLSLPFNSEARFSRVEAETVGLDETAVLILKAAAWQTDEARSCVEKALTLVLINECNVARELWWDLARRLKEPVLTLSLLPETTWGDIRQGGSLRQLRKWQLEQIAVIMREVDQACHTGDTIQLSNALESRVLPWLQKLMELIDLWHETMLASSRLGIKYNGI